MSAHAATGSIRSGQKLIGGEPLQEAQSFKAPPAAAGARVKAASSDSNAGQLLKIRGARLHNLKNVDVDIPVGKLVAFTGPSGCGKTTLVFDTIHAESQRQLLDALAISGHGSFRRWARPNADSISGLQPTVAISQRGWQGNPRSTVATATEVYDYMRLLWARLGELVCPACSIALRPVTPGQIVDDMLKLPPGTKCMLLAPVLLGAMSSSEAALSHAKKAGFVRARLDGTVWELDALPAAKTHGIQRLEIVIDRLVLKGQSDTRLQDSIALALKQGQGTVIAAVQLNDRWQDHVYLTTFTCPGCGQLYGELEPRLFSFNSPLGACPSCGGLGQRIGFDLEQVCPDLQKSLKSGVVAPWVEVPGASIAEAEKAAAAFLQTIGKSKETPWSDLTPDQLKGLWQGQLPDWQGLENWLATLWATSPNADLRETLGELRHEVCCGNCHGSRLGAQARSVTYAGQGIHTAAGMSVVQAETFFAQAQQQESQQQIAGPLFEGILNRLRLLLQVGLEYLTLDRPVDTLSGGEWQRVRLATGLGAGLSGICYVLDEPSAGLHPKDANRLVAVMRTLQANRNTVLVVEHDPEIIRTADWIVEMGPGAGERGGQVTCMGTVDQIRQCPQSTVAPFLTERAAAQLVHGAQTTGQAAPFKPASGGELILRQATCHNLKGITVAIPLGKLVCITGVSGSGKSSLVQDTLIPAIRLTHRKQPVESLHLAALIGAEQIARVISVEQRAVRPNSRSMVVTALGIFDEIRQLFAKSAEAKARGYSASRFSLMSKTGRCEVCQGTGVAPWEEGLSADTDFPCETCDGGRFNPATLEIRFRGLSLADLLHSSVDEAWELFQNFHTIASKLSMVRDVGLGYLSLGQPMHRVSGGERQRLTLASELGRVTYGHTLYVLDEPTTGLHPSDVLRLTDLLRKLAAQGHSVLVAEHNLQVISASDWVVDLGPESGDAGGFVVTQGPPGTVAQCAESWTGQALAKYFANVQIQ